MQPLQWYSVFLTNKCSKIGWTDKHVRHLHQTYDLQAPRTDLTLQPVKKREVWWFGASDGRLIRAPSYETVVPLSFLILACLRRRRAFYFSFSRASETDATVDRFVLTQTYYRVFVCHLLQNALSGFLRFHFSPLLCSLKIPVLLYRLAHMAQLSVFR